MRERSSSEGGNGEDRGNLRLRDGGHAYPLTVGMLQAAWQAAPP
jgi:hypothetical protein